MLDTTRVLYSLEDICTIPCITTDIESRKECDCSSFDLEGNYSIDTENNHMLPIIVAPMSCAFSDINDVEIYRQEGVNVVVPRTFSFEDRLELCKTRMTAFSLSEVEALTNLNLDSKHIYVCIDMANGHMEKQLEVGSKLRRHFEDRLVLMGGNIANPETFFEYQRCKFDYVRVGIGGGNACLTSTQTSIHYPMASLIDDIATDPRRNGTTKIIADGGISDYRDIVKCFALGADYVMMGRIFTKAALHGEPIGSEVSYYGMSTKKAQKEMGGEGKKTSEGRDLKLQKEYTLSGWVENFRDYLRSAMSYTDSRTLDHFRRYTKCGIMSPNSSYLINNK